MVDGINSTSTYVPNMSSSYASSPTDYSYAGFTGGYPSDSAEFSTQDQTKNNQSKLLKWAAVGGAALLAVVFRKNIPLIGKYFEEGGGGAKKALEEAGNSLKNIGKRSVKDESSSFDDLSKNLKAAEKKLHKANNSGIKADITEAKQLHKDAEKALEDYHKAAENRFLRANATLEKARGKAKKDEIKDLEKEVKKVKKEYIDDLVSGGMKKKEAIEKAGKAAKDGKYRAGLEVKNTREIKAQLKDLINKKPKGYTQDVKTKRAELINMLHKNGVPLDEAKEQVTKMTKKYFDKAKK